MREGNSRMDELSLEADVELSWETRLATIGRMLDRQPEPLPTLTITVMRRGIVLQRAPVPALSMTAAAVHGGPTPAPVISSPPVTSSVPARGPQHPATPDEPVRPTTSSALPGIATSAAATLPTLATRLCRWLQAGRAPAARSWMRDWL